MGQTLEEGATSVYQAQPCSLTALRFVCVLNLFAYVSIVL